MLSQTAGYALRTVLLIARTGGDTPARADALAESLQIPRNYLAKILHRLAQAGVLASSRGRNGGFLLGRPAAGISLAQVVGLFDRIEPRSQCLLGKEACGGPNPCPAHQRWAEVGDVVTRFYRETTVAELVGGRSDVQAF